MPPDATPTPAPQPAPEGTAPRKLDLEKELGLTVEWADGSSSFFPVAYLRKMSPSAEQRELRKEIAANPLTVLPASFGRGGPLRIESGELVGHYAIRLRFSDGHGSGIYSWAYLHQLALEMAKLPKG